jgi:hypothetical protein
VAALLAGLVPSNKGPFPAGRPLAASARADRVPCALVADAEASAALAEVDLQAGNERNAAGEAETHAGPSPA